MSKINDTLFLGSYQDARNQSFLSRNKITHIVTVGAELKPLYPKQYKYLYIPAHDMPQYRLSVYFDQIADFIHNAIEEEKGIVFVHCFAGISRSTTSVLAYLMKHRGMGLLEAKNFVKSKRSIIWPNPGFMQQLTAFSKRLTTGTVESKPESRSMNSLSNSFMRITATKTFDIKPKEFGSFMMIKNSTARIEGKNKEEVKKEEEKKVENFDYNCRKCGARLFHSSNILHNTGRTFNAHCNAIYVDPLPWMGTTQSRFSKVICPNTKCSDILGFKSLKGGKCGCNKEIGNMCGIYPLRVSYVKLKA